MWRIHLRIIQLKCLGVNKFLHVSCLTYLLLLFFILVYYYFVISRIIFIL